MANKTKSGSGTSQSAPFPTSQRYDPHYIEVVRPPRDDYRRLENVINHPALRTEPDTSYRASHASPHREDAGLSLFSNALSAPHARPTQSGEANAAQPAGQSSYAPQTPHPAAGHVYSEPYNAVGSIGREGQVFDNSEVYEEYRLYEQVHRLDENWSDDWTNVSPQRLVKPENGSLQNYRFEK